MLQGRGSFPQTKRVRLETGIFFLGNSFFFAIPAMNTEENVSATPKLISIVPPGGD
jgi:hypothetical protein